MEGASPDPRCLLSLFLLGRVKTFMAAPLPLLRSYRGMTHGNLSSLLFHLGTLTFSVSFSWVNMPTRPEGERGAYDCLFFLVHFAWEPAPLLTFLIVFLYAPDSPKWSWTMPVPTLWWESEWASLCVTYNPFVRHATNTSATWRLSQMSI